MNPQDQDIIQSFKLSYYSSKKLWQFESIYPIWPVVVSLVLFFLQYLFTGGNDLTVFLLFLTLPVFLCCVFVTRFYANAVLKISENELVLTQRGKSICYKWVNISNVAFLIPLNGLPYLGIVLVIYSNDSVEYIIIDSLYFINAKSRANKIGYEIEKYLKGFKFSIQKSDFEPRMLDKGICPPNILP